VEGTLRRAAAGLLLSLAVGCGGDGQTLEIDVAPIVEQLGREDGDARDRAVDRLVAIGPAVLPALVDALDDERPAVRIAAVEVLSALETPDVVEPLVGVAVRDPDDDVRYEALVALGALGGSPAELAAERAMADERPKVVLGGIAACANVCRDHKGFTQLVELALRAPLPQGLVARSVVGRLLLEGQDPEQVKVLRAVVADRAPRLLSEGTPPDVRLRAGLLASDLGDATALDALLVSAPESSSALRAHVVWGLGQVGDARAVPVLLGLRSTPVAPYAYDALRRIAERGVPEAQTAVADWKGDKPASAMPPPYALF
jgi:HEAT repeat protein